MAYLDDTGLAYFWGKIKTLFVKTSQGNSEANKMLITDAAGSVTTRKFTESYTIVNALPTTNISENTVYLIPTSIDPSGSGVTYTLSRSGDNIILTGSDSSTSSVDGGVVSADVPDIVEDVIADYLGRSY